jgi:CubicO group peptidase (beta-lactamase class C family)
MNAAVNVDHFSGSILVARDGQPIMSKGYGMANYELNVPNRPQTVFRLASVTKQFTAAAVMQLQERSKLNVNDPIYKHLDNCPAAWQPVTIRHLLTNTSGIPKLHGLPRF